ncbi:hypothetical protein C4580_00195 [Candidatus Woesearchaeota archaeon]|nr:MAG: hypothetical protein C4580_00195 [Candidatus Woesearchaeota archaeon]
MSDERLRELERKWQETGADDDFFSYLSALERGGRKHDASKLANTRLRNQRNDTRTLAYLLEHDPLAYTGWALREGPLAIRVLDGDEDYRIPLDDLCDSTPIENMAYVNSHLHLITQDFVQQTIPQTPGKHGRSAPSFEAIADHHNKQLLFRSWTPDIGHHLRLAENPSPIPLPNTEGLPEHLSPGKITSTRTIQNLIRIAERPGTDYHTTHPYLIEDDAVWYAPVLLPNQFLCPTKNERSDAITLLTSSGATRIPTKSRLGRRCNIAASPYDLGILGSAGNITAVEFDLHCLEALRQMRREQ